MSSYVIVLCAISQLERFLSLKKPTVHAQQLPSSRTPTDDSHHLRIRHQALVLARGACVVPRVELEGTTRRGTDQWAVENRSGQGAKHRERLIEVVIV